MEQKGKQLLNIYQSAIDVVHPKTIIQNTTSISNNKLTFTTSNTTKTFPLKPMQKVLLLSIGKASVVCITEMLKVLRQHEIKNIRGVCIGLENTGDVLVDENVMFLYALIVGC